MDKLTFAAFATKYCERQESTPPALHATLAAQRTRYDPTGWFMLEAQLLDSSYMGSLVILPYGPNNTFKTIPTHPVSPRGLASDTSVAVAYTLAESFPKEAPCT